MVLIVLKLQRTLRGQLDKNHVTYYKTTAQNVGYAFNDVPTLIHS